MKKSRVYKFENRYFRYDFDNCIVQYLQKATEEEIQDNKDWQKKYGKNLWDIDKDGYIEVDAAGLRTENWKRKAVRDEYLAEWIAEMQEACAWEMQFESF